MERFLKCMRLPKHLSFVIPIAFYLFLSRVETNKLKTNKETNQALTSTNDD